ncbi:cysteine--tRNA ligase [bacterium]|nr:cysteine--tRNA ligase [bacterium]
MSLFVYNTLTRKKEEFKPRSPGRVKMYVCGTTPYDQCHLGHARCYVVFDVIRKYLEYKGYEVIYVQNFTDVDDKIINRAKQLGSKVEDVAEKYISEYFEVMEKLNVKKANFYPKTTEHIKEMIKLVEKLIKKGYAYVIDGDVYFEIAKFDGYGKLSHRSREEMRAGARIEVDKRKKNPLDFALWKSAKPGEPYWESPWGKGRPGWHIECSAMSMQRLGATFDIHGGGQDLIFPHHENEIAQSEAATGKPFADYWLHNGFVTVNHEKMSKSLGNFFTLKEIYEKYSPDVVRFFLISQYYRSHIDFSDDKLEEARKSLERFHNTLENIEFLLKGLKAGKKASVPRKEDSNILEAKEKFTTAMDDDFNTTRALSYVFDLVSKANKKISEKSPDLSFLLGADRALRSMGSLLGFLKEKVIEKGGIDEFQIEKLIDDRNTARRKRDWEKADEIRSDLEKIGVILEDTSVGTRWKYRTIKRSPKK